MSADNNTMFCASCGTAGSDDVKLKICTACHLVKYCGVKCQKEHRSKHKKECKKRAAELHDEILFKQPESSCYGDCPICCLPLPIDTQKTTMMTCCGKLLCNGCFETNMNLEIERRLETKCAFCRKVVPDTEEEINERLMKRIETKDPVAMCQMGAKRHSEGHCKSAFEYYTKAATLGDVVAQFELSCLYWEGKGVEKDQIKARHHAEKAAIAGHPDARYNLGCFEGRNGKHNRAVKHFIIAAKLGYDKSLESLKDLYQAGFVSEEDFAAALRGHKAAVDATTSPERDEAVEYYKRLEGHGSD